MITSQPRLRVMMVLFAALLPSAPCFSRAAVAAPPTEELSLTAVSDTLADVARQQSERGRRYEQAGQYSLALTEYRDAIAGLDRSFDRPSNQASGNPKAFLVRGGAAVDAARALSRIPGYDRDEVRRLAKRAELDFRAVARNCKADAAGRDLIQKAMLGEGYARLLRGDLEGARTNLLGVRYGQTVGQMVAAQQVQSAVGRINIDIAAQDKAPPQQGPQQGSKAKLDKLTASMNLGQEIVKSFFPKYQGLALAIGDFADAFRK